MMADEFGEFGCEGRARRNPLRVGPSWVDSSLHCWCDQWEDHEEDLILFSRLLGESRPGWLQLSFFFCAPRQCQTKIVYIADQNCDFYLKKNGTWKLSCASVNCLKTWLGLLIISLFFSFLYSQDRSLSRLKSWWMFGISDLSTGKKKRRNKTTANTHRPDRIYNMISVCVWERKSDRKRKRERAINTSPVYKFVWSKSNKAKKKKQKRFQCEKNKKQIDQLN